MKEKKPFYKKWWFYAIIAFIVIGVALSPSEDELAEIEAEEAAAQVKAEEEQKEKDKEKKEKAEAKAKKEETDREALIAAFELASEEMVKASDGVIKEVTIEYNTNHYKVNVFVDELIWASSNESEKMSFATTIGTSIENSLSPNSTYVDIVSATNSDVVATQKLFGGWKIKR